jgi:predicted PurR-regulated permease PerM
MNSSASSAQDFRKGILFAFGLALGCYVAWLVRAELLLLYVSALFAVVLSPLVRATERFRIGRWRPVKGTAIFLLMLGLLLVIALFGFLALPPVIADLQGFGREMPARMPEMMQKFKSIPFAQHLDTADIFSRLQDVASSAATTVLLSIKDWAGKLFDVAMGVVMTVYFILEGDHAYRWFLSLVPEGQQRDRLDATLQRANVRIGKWLLGQGALMLILGVVSTLVYLALGVRYAYALGVLTGTLNVIPVLGAAVCVALALLVAAIDSWGRVVGVGVFYLIWLQAENSYLIPRIMKNRVGLPALAILVALLLGSSLAGVLGAMVSVPTAVLVAELLDEYAVKTRSAA